MTRPIDAIRAYHQATKHAPQAYAPSPGFLDWDSQPDPFRRFVGASEIPLPLIRGEGFCAYDNLYDAQPAPAEFNAQSLGLFLELAFGLSAWKVAGPDRWALRNNPSSGNLHPTESYLLLWRAVSEALPPGLYHYAPKDHLLERRALLAAPMVQEMAERCPDSFGALGLSSIPWREEWKYGSRAFRYCQMDVGHALAAARFSAGVLGWQMRTDTSPGDDLLAALLGLNRPSDFTERDQELPDVLAVFGPANDIPWDRLAEHLGQWTGKASRVSEEQVAWPQVAQAIAATHKPPTSPVSFEAPQTPAAALFPRPVDACTVIRNRRSAQRMDGQTGMAREDFERALTRTLPRSNRAPFDILPFAPALNLLLFVHAVEGLPSGLYLLNRAPHLFQDFRQACTAEALVWDALEDTPLPLHRLMVPADCRKIASQISCFQGIAGRGAFSLGMIGAIGPTLEQEGAWAYRRLHWEAGMIGQVLYLEAEASGLRGTGIGCFFDDEVHTLLGLGTNLQASWQDLYHFTVGAPVEDDRLTSEPAYGQLLDRPWQ
ncbi:SagB/ThcOx family dehydrogenase [Magnetospira thiophila]